MHESANTQRNTKVYRRDIENEDFDDNENEPEESQEYDSLIDDGENFYCFHLQSMLVISNSQGTGVE